MGVLAVGTAWARAALYPGGLFASRYATLAVPFLCIVYYAWELTRLRPLTRFLQTSLFFLAATFLLRNRDHGYGEATAFQGVRTRILQEIRQGVPTNKLHARYCGTLYYVCNTDDLPHRMRMLRERGAGDFRKLRD